MWVVGGVLHQDLLAGLLVIVAIGVGGFLLATLTRLLIGVPTEQSRAHGFDWDKERDYMLPRSA